MNISKNITQGHYYRKQIGSPSWLISWSHASRFRKGIALAKPFAGLRLLDYGCGDGTFPAMLAAQTCRPELILGADLDDGQVNDCSSRLGNGGTLRFCRIDRLIPDGFARSFDVIFCMEVLEHVVDLEPVFQHWKQLAKPGASIIVSVPVETGLALMVKQTARMVAGWRGIGDYPGSVPYTWTEFGRSVFAGEQQHIIRPVHGVDRGSPGYCHKGFNWQWLAGQLRQHFMVDRVVSSPVTWFPPGLGSQVWFVMRVG